MVSDRVTSRPHHVTAIKQAAAEWGYARGCRGAESRGGTGRSTAERGRTGLGGSAGPARSTTPRTTRACVCKTITRVHAFARGEHAAPSPLPTPSPLARVGEREERELLLDARGAIREHD